MSVILYARVSTSTQGEKDLSIPAQVRTLRRLCAERHWSIAGTYTDIASGTSLRARPGLLGAVERACKDKEITIFFVHRLDRFARSLFTYLTLKGKLKQHGVRLISAVENFEPSPMGDFIERIMAAQAEFYSANLGLQIKGGLEERLRRGEWPTAPPLGYIKESRQVRVDPARAQFIQLAFERWATGEFTSPQLADELHGRGLVSRYGRKLDPTKLCDLLHNPFYFGTMVMAGKTYPGIHPPLVSKALFDKCQQVFRERRSGPQHHLYFLLSKKLICPRCVGFLVGEQHQKKSGRIYRYYRCHRTGCRFIVSANELEERVKMNVKERLYDDKQRFDIFKNGDPAQMKVTLHEVVERVELDGSLHPVVSFSCLPIVD